MNKLISILFLITFCASVINSQPSLFNVNNVVDHLNSLQSIAYDIGGGNRAAGTIGYNASADYVVEYLTKNTNLSVSVQNFPFYTYRVAETPILQQVITTNSITIT